MRTVDSSSDEDIKQFALLILEYEELELERLDLLHTQRSRRLCARKARNILLNREQAHDRLWRTTSLKER